MWSMMNSQRDSMHHVALRSLWRNSPQGSGWYRTVYYSLKWSSTRWLACCQWPTAACSSHECVPSGRGASSSPLCHSSCRSWCREQYLTHSLQMRSEVKKHPSHFASHQSQHTLTHKPAYPIRWCSYSLSKHNLDSIENTVSHTPTTSPLVSFPDELSYVEGNTALWVDYSIPIPPVGFFFLWNLMPNTRTHE